MNKMKIKPVGKTRYVINNMLIVADSYKAAIKEYVSVHGSGANVIFAAKN